jgi:bifunctional DNA-binding transcriptional regulator/antitoxin component of YhaV-PrlF toxin-antitoxin module
MISTHLSSQGQVIIPKPICQRQHGEPEQELIIIEVKNGILLKPKSPFKTRLEQVAKCLAYKGKAKTLDDMDAAIARGVLENDNGCRNNTVRR